MIRETTLSPHPQVELWQAEWCPWSHRVRQRLTELGISYLTHQVPAERPQRVELMAISGQDRIPVLSLDGQVVVGSEAILVRLEESFADPPGAELHRTRAHEQRHEVAV